VVFFNRPIAEGPDGSVVSVLAVTALSTGQEGIDPLTGERVIAQEWLQTYAVEPYRLRRDALPA